MAEIFNTIATPLMTLFGLWFVSKQIWYYLLKDLIVKKLDEIDKGKQKTRKLVSESLSNIASLEPDTLREPVSADDVEFVKEVCSELNELGLHNYTSLSNMCLTTAYTFGTTELKDLSYIADDSGFISNTPKYVYFGMFRKALMMIEARAVRPLYLPTRLSVSRRKPENITERLAFNLNRVRYVKGIEQGPSPDLLNIEAYDLYRHVVDCENPLLCRGLHKSFLRCLGDNRIVHLRCIQERALAPLSISHREEPIFGGSSLYLCSLRKKVFQNDDMEPIYEFTYVKKDIFGVSPIIDFEFFQNELTGAGFSNPEITVYDNRDTVVLKLDAAEAEDFYHRNYFSLVNMLNVSFSRRVMLLLAESMWWFWVKVKSVKSH